jgi:hypothetical protein
VKTQMKKIFITLVIAVFASLATIGQAKAGVLLSGNTIGNGGGATGSYHVVIDENSNYNFKVASITANGGAQAPNDNVDKIKITFYSGKNATGSVITVTGNIGTAGVNTASSNWGAAVPTTGGYDDFFSPSKNSGLLLANGSNTFATDTGGKGVIPGEVVVNHTLTAQSVTVAMTDEADSYFATFNAQALPAPEGASIALFLAGLLPLAFVLRRRAGSKL